MGKFTYLTIPDGCVVPDRKIYLHHYHLKLPKIEQLLEPHGAHCMVCTVHIIPRKAPSFLPSTPTIFSTRSHSHDLAVQQIHAI